MNTVKKKQYIPQHVREEVWRLYGSSLCWCCQQEPISSKNKHLGHIQAETNGGQPTIDNLRPICQNCNLRMGTLNMFDFMIQQGYPIRDIAMIQRVFNKKHLPAHKLRDKPVFFIHTKQGYSCSIGTKSLFQKYPFLQSVSLEKLFSGSFIKEVQFLFVSKLNYSLWIQHMIEKPKMFQIYQELKLSQ